jgi:23S rRNA (guanosine2251-2'-O)-methyltransferase
MKMQKRRAGNRSTVDGSGNEHRHESGSRTVAANVSVDRVYGIIPVLEALRAGHRRIEHITIAEGAKHQRLRELLDLAKAAGVPVRRAPKMEIERTLGNVTHQGVTARIAASHYADVDELLDELAARVGTEQPPLVLALDGLEDPRNLGAVLRTAECAGVHGVFTPERRAVGLTETVAKTAAGALEYVRVARVTNLARLIEQLKERNIWVVGTSADAPREYTEWDWTLPTAIFLGSEGAGLHRLLRERCDMLVRIPVLGQLKSLNVAVASGVVLFEALRQRRAAKKSF